MSPPRHDLTWLDASETISLSELSEACQVSAAELDELVEYGALAPVNKTGEEFLFSAACTAALRAACKLRKDYDLDLFTVALLLDYLNRIERLEREVRSLQAHLPTHLVGAHREGPQPWREPHASADEQLARIP